MFKFQRLDWNTEINMMPSSKRMFFRNASTHEKIFFKNKLIGYYIISAPEEYSVTRSKVYSIPRSRYFIPLNIKYNDWVLNSKKYEIYLGNYIKPTKKYVKEELSKMIERNVVSV